jgi:hypothetical protein
MSVTTRDPRVPMRCSIRLAAALAFILASLSPGDAHPQSSRLLNALGYGLVGGSIGLGATVYACGAACPGEPLAATLGGSVFGLILGTHVASTADLTVAEGRPVGDAHLAALGFGTVVGGAALGLIAGIAGAGLIHDAGEGSSFGSHERTLAILALAGGTLGFLQLRRNWGRLTATGVEVTPLATVHGRPALVLQLRF